MTLGCNIVCGCPGGIGTTQQFVELGTYLTGWLDTEQREAILRKKNYNSSQQI